VFPPLPFSLLFDGAEVAWSCSAFKGYIPLSRAAQYPFLSGKFDQVAPDWAKGFCPPFLSVLREPGVVQIWSGLIARAEPGYNLLVRPPVNLPRSRGYDQYEGVVEADIWFGPLFTNIRLIRTGFPVTFSPADALFMVQPVRREDMSDPSLNSFSVLDLNEFSEREWAAFRKTVVSRNEVCCPVGEDARLRRKRASLDRWARHPA
jgi:hypothetical protein